MQSSVICGVKVNMMEKTTSGGECMDRIRDSMFAIKLKYLKIKIYIKCNMRVQKKKKKTLESFWPIWLFDQ